MASGKLTAEGCKVEQSLAVRIHQDEYSTEDMKAADETVAGLHFTEGEDYAEYKLTRELEIGRFESQVDRFCTKHELTDYRDDIMDGAYADVNTEYYTPVYCTQKGKGCVLFGVIASHKVSDKKIDVAFAIYSKRFLHVVFNGSQSYDEDRVPKKLTPLQQQHLKMHCIDRARKKFAAKYPILRLDSK